MTPAISAALTTIVPILLYALPLVVAAIGTYVGRNKVLADRAHALEIKLTREITAAQVTLPQPLRFAAVDMAYAFFSPGTDSITRSTHIHDLLFKLKALYGDFWAAEGKAEKDATKAVVVAAPVVPVVPVAVVVDPAAATA